MSHQTLTILFDDGSSLVWDNLKHSDAARAVDALWDTIGRPVVKGKIVTND